MKTRKEREQRLLGEIFAEDFEPASEEVKEVLREFRVAWWRQKTVRAVLAAAALIAVGTFAPYYLRDEGEKPNPLVSSPTVEVVTPEKVEAISDEELLNLFPAGSCFLAELDGKQVLVFKEAKLAKEVLQ